jgi:pimeloyl-ACP methyl ester carboxylesterase
LNKATLYLALLVSSILFSACVADPYPGLHERRINDQSLYVFNKDQKRLLVYIEGSGLSSVLGIKSTTKWKSVNFTYFLANNLDGEITLAIPEKLYFKKGKDYRKDKNALKKYTVQDLVESYSKKIDRYIDENSFDEIILFGASEGGLLAPKIFNAIKNKSKISKMIIWGAGGYSQEECFRILATGKIPMPESYLVDCKRIDEVKKDIALHPDSIDKFYFGCPYARWHSFFNYHPIDEYIGIDIPVLFIQGLKDFNSPFESVKYIEENIHNEKYEFNYHEGMGHMPTNEEEIKGLIRSMYIWIKK